MNFDYELEDQTEAQETLNDTDYIISNDRREGEEEDAITPESVLVPENEFEQSLIDLSNVLHQKGKCNVIKTCGDPAYKVVSEESRTSKMST